MKYLYINSISFLFVLGFLISCGTTKDVVEEVEQPPQDQTQLKDANTFLLTEISDDDTYGYTEKNPICVGGIRQSQGPLNERRFLNALASPDGKDVDYYREGSCCFFETEYGMYGRGLLDIYVVTWKDQDEPIILYFNFYDFGPLKVPVGFTIRK